MVYSCGTRAVKWTISHRSAGLADFINICSCNNYYATWVHLFEAKAEGNNTRVSINMNKYINKHGTQLLF